MMAGVGLTFLGGASRSIAQAMWAMRRHALWSRDQIVSFDRYVDSVNGLDTNDGLTPTTAWLTLAKVATAGAAGAGAGWKVGLRRGSTFRESFTVPADNMTFGGYGPLTSARPYMKGSADYTSGAWTSQANSTWSKTATGMTDAAATLAWLDGVTTLYRGGSATTLTSGQFWTNAAGNLLYVRLPDDSNPTGHTVEVASNAGSTQWRDRAIGTIVQDIRIGQFGTGVVAAVLRDPAALAAGGSYRRNEIGPGGNNGIDAKTVAGMAIEDNYIHDLWSGVEYPSGAGIGVFADTACENVHVRHNRVERCYQGIVHGQTAKSTQIYRNVVIQSKVNCISTSNGVAGWPASVFNNFVWHRPSSVAQAGHGIVMNSPSTVGSVWRNNIVVCDYQGVTGNVQCYSINVAIPLAGADIDYNLGWRLPGCTADYGRINTTGYPSLAAWKTAMGANVVGAEAHGIEADPQITDLAGGDYSPQSTSPAINAGVALGYGGEPTLGTAPDMGAYEVS